MEESGAACESLPRRGVRRERSVKKLKFKNICFIGNPNDECGGNEPPTIRSADPNANVLRMNPTLKINT